MPHNLQFSQCISFFHLECGYLSFLWISPEVIVSVVWSQACECFAKSLFHLLKGLLLCGNAQVIGVRETPLTCVGMNWLVICIESIDVEQQMGQGRCLVEGHSSVCAICCVSDDVHKQVCMMACSGYLKGHCIEFGVE